MSQRSYERDVWIFGVHDEPPDGVSIAKASKHPGLTGVNGLINTVAADDVAADASFTRPDINDIRVRLGNSECADRRRGFLFLVKNGLPVEATVRGLPNATRDAAKVVSIVLADHAGHSEHTPAAERSNQAIGERFPWAFIFFVVLLSSCRRTRCLR